MTTTGVTLGRQHDGRAFADSVHCAEAFRDIVHRHMPALHRYATRRIGPTYAEDAVAETFTIAFRRRAAFDVSRPDAAPWLYGILTNVLHGHRRHEARRLRLLERVLREADHGFADAAIDRAAASAQWKSVLADLRALRGSDREALLLHVLGGLSYQEVSQALDVPLGTVASRINRARRSVQRTHSPEACS